MPNKEKYYCNIIESPCDQRTNYKCGQCPHAENTALTAVKSFGASLGRADIHRQWGGQQLRVIATIDSPDNKTHKETIDITIRRGGVSEKRY